MNRCIYKTVEGNCSLHSDGIDFIEPCVESPCEDEKFEYEIKTYIKPKQTNADRIRAMSDEELAEFIILSPEMEFEVCRHCINGNPTNDDRGQCLRKDGRCYANDMCEAFKKYLKQEVTQ